MLHTVQQSKVDQVEFQSEAWSQAVATQPGSFESPVITSLPREETVQAKRDVDTGSRLFYLDNLRIYLTILVILHHMAIAYGGTGDWSVKDPAVDAISPILLTLFNALNQSYFMTAFFLMAGYFTPRSVEKKGARSFLSDRLVRLGIPILIFVTIIRNINVFIIGTLRDGLPFRPRFSYHPGHLWFLQLLLIFAVVYVVFVSLRGNRVETGSGQDHLVAFPSDRKLVAAIGVLALLTFGMRLMFPVGETIVGMQPGHFVHYGFAFFVGTMAYRRNWFRSLPSAQGRRWGKVALVVFPLLIVFMIVGGAVESDENVLLFLGGFHWQSLAYAVWETIMMVSMILFLLTFFRTRFNHSGSLGKWAAASTFTVYIIHQTFVVALNVLFLPVGIPTILKFFVVSAIAIPLCFSLSVPLRKMPAARRVLG